MTMIKVFISSVQREFADERELLCKYIREDALLGKFFQPFIFEGLPAINLSAPQAYLAEAAASEIYLGLYGRDYGYEDAEGVSPTEREYDTATENNRHRIIFIKRCEERHPKEKAFIQKVEQDVVRKSFETYEELRTAVYSSLIRFLEEKEYLRLFPWDATYHRTATMDDIDPEKVKSFVALARERRNFKLAYTEDKIPEILHHLNLTSDDGRLTNSALLLFAKNPQKFFITSEIKCLMFPSPLRHKPILSYQVYHGSLFEMVDSAVGYVMQHIDAYVGTHKTPSVEVKYEIPIAAVTEIIVNAATHRSYESNASVQVELYPDRLEVWNPGQLPYGLTPAQLSKRHKSIPTNPILAHPVYLAGYIERIGTGTTDVIEECLAAGLEAPVFEQDGDFKVTLWRKKHSADKEKHIADAETHIADTKTHIADIKLSKKQLSVIEFCETPKTSREIIAYLGIVYQARAVKRYITDLVAAGLLLPLVMGKPNSPNQKYVSVQDTNDKLG